MKDCCFQNCCCHLVSQQLSITFCAVCAAQHLSVIRQVLLYNTLRGAPACCLVGGQKHTPLYVATLEFNV